MMKKQGKAFINTFLLAVLLAINIHASATPQIKVLSTSEPLKTPVYFSGTRKSIPLELTGVNECLNVTATLWQITTRLGAEIAQQSIVECKNSIHDFTQATVKLYFQFTTPVVKHDSKFKLEFTSCNDQQSCKPLGDLTFSVLPDDLLDPIGNWAKKNTLHVHDKSHVLQSFFEGKSIEYIESTGLIPKNEPLISLIVITKENMDIDKLLPSTRSQSVILFREYASEFPTIIDRTNGRASLIDVHVPIIGKLGADAAAHKMFLKLFYMLPQTKVFN